MKRLLACILALALITLPLAACSGNSGGSASTPAASTPASTATSGTGSSAAQSDAAGSDLSAYDQLMAMEDVLPLASLAPSHLDSRADVKKALPVEPKDDVTIGWAGASMGSTYFEAMVGSARDAAEEYGYKFIEQNANFDLALQSTHVDTFITQGVDAIVLNAVDLYSSTNDINRCVEAGIPVIVTGPTAAYDDYEIVTNFLSGCNDAGFEVGKYTAEELYKDGEVLQVGMTVSKISDGFSNSRPCGWISGYLYQAAEMAGNPYDSIYDAYLDGYNIWVELKAKGKVDASDKGVNFVGVGMGDGTDAAAGQKASSDLLTAHPDMDLLVVEMDSQLPGVYQEIKQHGLTPGEDLKIVTCADATIESLDYIKSGELMATATNAPEYPGRVAVELIHKIFTTGGAEQNDMPANSITPTQCVNAGNVDEYYVEGQPFAKYIPWEPMTTDEYNTAHAND